MVILLIEMMDHLGKGIEPRTSSGHGLQNPRVAMVIVLISRWTLFIYDDEVLIYQVLFYIVAI